MGTRSFGAEALAFVRYVLIASVLFLLQGMITELLSNNIRVSSSLEDNAGTAIVFFIVTVIFASVSSVMPFAMMVVIAKLLRINAVVFYGVAGCVMAALTSLEVSWVFSGAVSYGWKLPRWENLYRTFGSLLLPVVTATLAYWWFDVRKSVAQSGERAG